MEHLQAMSVLTTETWSAATHISSVECLRTDVCVVCVLSLIHPQILMPWGSTCACMTALQNNLTTSLPWGQWLVRLWFSKLLLELRILCCAINYLQTCLGQSSPSQRGMLPGGYPNYLWPSTPHLLLNVRSLWESPIQNMVLSPKALTIQVRTHQLTLKH